MRQRRETVEHPFGTLKMRMGATHFLTKRLWVLIETPPRRPGQYRTEFLWVICRSNACMRG
jgi:hypothetical protein